MAVKVGFVAQKGGVGKTTLAEATACGYATNGWDVKIADLDTRQSTSYEWLADRLDAQIEPVIAVEKFGTVAQALKVAPHYDLLVLDGGGQASTTTVDIAKTSDLVVIPTGFSRADMRPAVTLAHELVTRHGIPAERLCFAFCRAGDSEVEQVEARSYLLKSGYHVLSGSIPEKTLYRRAQDGGYALTETRHKGLRDKADQLVQAIIDRVTQLTK